LSPPRVTVAVACRDDADVLELTLDDLFSQSGPSWEALVVDDASLDEDTRARLRALRWPGTRTLRVEAAAPGAAARAAAEAAAGDCLLFLRAGDRVAPLALEKLLAALDADAGAVVALAAADPARSGARQPGLARRAALSPPALRADDPVGFLVSGGARTVVVPEPLFRPRAEREPLPRPSVRARSLVTTASAPEAAVNGGPEGARPSPAVGEPVSLELGEAVRRMDTLASALREARHDIAALRSSASWRITAPLRVVHRWLTREGR
jgi:glycosyltransferase involved in cell wall biosynthesis